MKMIEHDHFIYHFYCYFSVFSPILLSIKTWCCGRSLMTSSGLFSKLISCCFHRSVFDLVNHQYGICRMYSEENSQDFRLPVPGLYPWKRVMLLLLSTEASFKPGGPFFWELTSEHLPQGLIFCCPSLACKGSGYPRISYSTSCWHYWHIWNRQPHILPLHSSASAGYGYIPSSVYPHWKPWTRGVRWTILRLSVYYWPLHRTRWVWFPCLLRWDVYNGGWCWRCDHWLFGLQTFPFPVQEPFWWWKDASGNPVYTGVKCRIGYESHPFDWWAFQEA